MASSFYINKNILLAIFSPIRIGGFVVLFLLTQVSFGQNKIEANYKKMYETKQKRTLFLQEPYFYAGVTGGLGINLPTKRLFAASIFGAYDPDAKTIKDRASAFFNYGFYVGFQIKKHHISLNYDALQFAYGTDYFVVEGLGLGRSLKLQDDIPYLSLMYQYDVLGKGRLIGLQPGLHFGLGFYNNINDKMSSGYGSGALAIYSTYKKENSVGFGFGPSLNFEVNITRWFSFNFYQQLAYFPKTILQSDITIYQEGDMIGRKEVNSNLLNYSMNVALRFKMYLPNTRFKVAEKMNGN